MRARIPRRLARSFPPSLRLYDVAKVNGAWQLRFMTRVLCRAGGEAENSGNGGARLPLAFRENVTAGNMTGEKLASWRYFIRNVYRSHFHGVGEIEEDMINIGNKRVDFRR